MRASILTAVGVVSLVAAPRPAPAAWWTATSARAEVVTDAGPAAAEELAARLDAFHDVLAAAFPTAGEPAGRPVVVAFAGRGDLSRYVPLIWGRPQPLDGVFQGGDRPYVALTLAAAQPAVTAAHEYVHVRLAPALAAQPPWVGEGLAEVLSAWATREDGTAVAGLAVPAHLAVLRDEGLLPLRIVLTAGYASPEYQESDRRPRLYASAWALAHYLFVGRPDGRARLETYLDAVASGTPLEPAFASAFGVTIDEVERSLPAYVAAPLPFLSPGARPRAAVPVHAEAVPEAVALRHLAELALRAGRLTAARDHLQDALRAAPGDGETHEALAETLRRLGKPEEAARHLEAALAAGGAQRPRVLLRRAQQIVGESTRRGDAPTDEEERRAVALLEAALAQDPGLADAADLVARLSPQPVGRRIAHLAPAVARHPHRTELALTLASLHVRRNDHAAAARVLVRARDLARDDAQRFLAAHMLGKLAGIRSLAAEARGTLVRVACGPAGELTFEVRAASRTLRLRAGSPSAFFVYDEEGRTLERDVVCGPHQAPVVVSYRAAGALEGTDGTLLWLSFAGPS